MSIPVSPCHAAALAYARCGIPVFPCFPNSKVPATPRGQNDETTDERQINEWFRENPSYNVAFRPAAAGWAVVDIDPGGDAPWESLVSSEGGCPPTFGVRTPRGGHHLYFDGVLPPSVKKLVKGEPIDTRGGGSYVLIPPSTTPDGAYEVENDIAIAPLPAWIGPRLSSHLGSAAAAVEDLDLPVNISRAREYLFETVRSGRVAIEGAGGDNASFILSCELLGLGLSAERTLDLLLEIWNPHCLPPWEPEALKVKVENAAAYAQNEQGAFATEPSSLTFAGNAAVSAALAESQRETEKQKSKFHFEDETEQDVYSEPTWLVPELLPDATTVLLVGPTGTFKSFLALDVALAIAHGKACFTGQPAHTGSVFYGAHEGRKAIRGVRRIAWRLAHDVTADGLQNHPGNFFVGRAPIIANPGEREAFCSAIAERSRQTGKSPKLIILDTAAKCMVGMNENDARDCGIFVQFCDQLVETFGCTVLVIAHSGKDAARGARGSSALQAGFDTILEVEGDRHSKTVSVRVVQHKDADEREKPWTLRGQGVGPSLVFQPCEPGELARIRHAADPFDPVRIGTALLELNARGEDHAVTTAILADVLVKSTPTETPAQREDRVQKTVRQLSFRARGALAMYCYGKGRDIRWAILSSAP